MKLPTIGILKNEVSKDQKRSLLGCILKTRELGYELVATDNLELLDPSRIDGLIYMQGREIDVPMLKRLEKNGLPVVACDSVFPGITSVAPDNRGAVFAAAQHLNSLGHRRIAFLRGSKGIRNAEERFQAFRQALNTCGLDFDPSLVSIGEADFFLARNAVYNLLSNRRDFSAILCSNDRSAIGAITAIRQSGLKVPEDIAVIGISNFAEVLSMTDDRITSLNYPTYQIGIKAVELLHQKISGGEIPQEETRLPFRLMLRETCGGSILEIPNASAERNEEDRLLSYLFQVGASLSNEEVTRLVSNFHRRVGSGEHPIEALREVFIEGIENGLNPSIFHQLLMQLGNKFEHWTPNNQSQPTTGQVLEALQESCRDNIMFYKRHAADVDQRFTDITESVFNLQVDITELGNIAPMLRELQLKLEAKYISLLAFESPTISLGAYNGDVALWQIDESATTVDKTIKFNSRSFKYDELLPSSRNLRSIVATILKSKEGFLGILFIDTDTDFLQSYHKLGPLVSASLQRISLFESVQKQTRKLERQTKELKEANHEAEIAKSKEIEFRQTAEKANKAKSDFLTVMSHEIRTPLNCIIGMSDIAAIAETPEDANECIRIVKDSANSLLEIVNDILDFSKIETGRLKLRYANFNIERLVSAIAEMQTPVAQAKGLELRYAPNQNIPETVAGDPIRLRQILTNLIDNAIRFTESGNVEIRIAFLDESDSAIHLKFSVSDTGAGMSQEVRNSIFDVFKSSQLNNDQLYSSVGLGLAIVSRLVSQMDGKIEVESELGKGTQFTIVLPFKKLSPASVQPISPTNPTQVRSLKMLVCSSAYDIESILSQSDRLNGIRIDYLDTLYECVAAWKKAYRQKEPYAVVLVELDDSRQENREKLEEVAFFDPSQLVVVTPRGPSSANLKITRNTFYHIEEPLRKDDLIKNIDQAFGHAENPRKNPSETLDASLSKNETKQVKHRILLVDDNASNLLVARAMLEREGHAVTKAFNGQQAIDLWLHGQFDLILMDVQMPGKDGWQTTREIREAEASTGKRTPIIALTSHAIEGYDQKCYDAGMDAYIAKPIERESLVEFIREAPAKYSKPKELR
ncbi:MAG: substrate-binding domain-containing protein [Verrucomicrobiota bacterium]